MLKKIKDWYLVIFVVAIGAILRLSILYVSNGTWKEDCAARVIKTLKWLNALSFLPDNGDWLPLHFYLMGAGLKIYNDPLLTPRLVSLVFGLLSLFVFYKLTDTVFGKRTAFLSLCILTFYPIHILCSVVSLSEVILLFFLLSSFYFFFMYLSEGRRRLLIISGIFLACASMTRFEAWLFILFFPVLLIYERNRKWNDMAIFFLIAFILPLAYLLSMDAKDIMSCKHSTVGAYLLGPERNLSNALFYWQEKLYRSFGAAAYFLAALGLIFSLKAKKMVRYYAACFSVILLFFILGTSALFVSVDNTYLISFGTLMIPLFIYGTDRLIRHKALKATAMFILVVTISAGLIKDIDIPDSCSSEVELVVDYLRHHADKDDKVLIDCYGSEHYYISLASGLYNNAMLLHKVVSGDTSAYFDYIEREKPRYILYSHDGVMDKGVIDFLSPRLKTLLTTDIYTIYELEDS